MDFLLYMIFSSLESAAIIMLALKSYRFYISEYAWQITCSSIIISFVSYLFRMEFSLGAFDIFIQLILYLILLTFLFRVHPLFSGLMALTGFSGNVVVQFIVYIILKGTGVILASDIKGETDLTTMVIQGSSLLITYGLVWLLHKTHFGFSFVPHRRKVKFTRENKALLVLITLSMLLFGASFFLYYNTHSKYLAVSSLVIIVLLISLLFAAIKKESGQ
ncbi:hypothetical protein [Paenibacillus elgii]|uniref:hypothetical protein n=1 Tax=Paenibacillus elgii TaxID=189691 RepID=UPI0013D8B184|nr:hypothetical protein [Paenibacillus elgii]